MNNPTTDKARLLVDQFLTGLPPEASSLPLKDAFPHLLQLVRQAHFDEAKECAQMLRLPGDTIRLHAGEMSATEMRTVQAVLAWRERAISARHRSSVDIPEAPLVALDYAINWELYRSKAGHEKVNQHLTVELFKRVLQARKDGDMTKARATTIRDEMYVIMDQFSEYGARDTEPEVALVVNLEKLIPAASGLTR